MRDKHSKQLTVGVITDHIEGNFQSGFWPGLMDAAQENNSNLIFFSGFLPEVPYEFEKNHDVIFDLASDQALDGILLVSAVLKTYLTQDTFVRFVKKFEGLPIASISFADEHIPSVIIDHSIGLNDVIDHLVEFHHYRKLAFISGSEKNPDATIRLRVYKEALKRHNIPYNESLVVPGAFDIPSGKRGVEILLQERKVNIDAIIAASDDIAMGVMYRLKELDIDVPGEIAVTGFDDVSDVKLFNPPLTTVRQPLYEQCKLAFSLLIDMIDNGTHPENIVLPSKMILRQSCGCYPHALSHYSISKCIETTETETAPKSETYKTDRVQEEIYTYITSQINSPGHPVYNWIHLFLNFLLEPPNMEYDRTAFMKLIKKFPINEVIKASDELFMFDLISFTQKTITAEVPLNKKEKNTIDTYFLESFILISEMVLRPDALVYSKEVDELFGVRVISQYILGTLNLDDLKKIILTRLPSTGVHSCHIVLYNGEAKKIDDLTWNLPFSSKLILSYQKDHDLLANGTSVTFETKKILPEKYFRNSGCQFLIAMPLFFQNEQYGYILQEFSSTNYYVYETLRNLTSSSLKATSLLENEKLIVKSLHAAKQQLEESNISLTKLDILKNDFIANITHDFRSPLMVILNTADLGYKYDRDFSEESVKKRYKTILMAAAKLTTSIDRLLDISRMDAKGMVIEVYRVDLTHFLTQIANAYLSMILSANIELKTDFPKYEIANFYSNTDKLEEILMNILSNTIKFVDPETGKVEISLTDKPAAVEIRVQDNGIGIPKENLESIFNRFEQVHDGKSSQYQGSGIGLAYAKQLSEYLSGSIRAESDGPGHGACFILEFPKGTKMYENNPSIEIVADKHETASISDKKILGIQSEINEKLDYQLDTDIDSLTELKKVNLPGEFNYKKAIILVVDDNKQSRQIVINYLKNAGYMNFIQAKDGKMGLETAYKYHPDLIICDYNMPKMGGDELHDQLIKNSFFNKIPFIFVTAIFETSILKARKKKGAVAYLQKPIIEDELVRTVSHNLQCYMEQQKLLQQVDIDMQTSLYNKRFLENQLDLILKKRLANPLSLLLIETDQLRNINTIYGYQLGDHLLHTLGETFKKILRPYDIVGRFGIKQFLIIMDGTGLSESLATAEKIVHTIRDLKFKHDNEEIAISVSIGVVSLFDNIGYILEKMSVSGLEEIYITTSDDETDWEKIQEQKTQLAKLLVEMARHALNTARTSYCRNCNFRHTDRNKFVDNKCPQCGSTEIHIGKGRISTL